MCAVVLCQVVVAITARSAWSEMDGWPFAKCPVVYVEDWEMSEIDQTEGLLYC